MEATAAVNCLNLDLLCGEVLTMSTNRLIASAASFSWIHPKTGLPEVDKGG